MPIAGQRIVSRKDLNFSLQFARLIVLDTEVP